MTLTQANRVISIDTPLGEDVLLLRGIEGIEGISVPFSFELDLVSELNNIGFGDIIGRNVTLSILLPDGSMRFFNGIISRFSQGSGAGVTPDGNQLAHYSATMVPWFWLLTRTSDSRIFQELSVPAIVEKIFMEKGFVDYKLNLHDIYEPKEYCVQYQETDFNFISRLMEQEGIFYFFEHEDGKHTMILGDSSVENKPCPKQETARYQRSHDSVVLEDDTITHLDIMQEIRIGKYTANDYNFKLPATDLVVEAVCKQPLGPGERELYEYPAEYESRVEGDRLANLRMQVEEAKTTTITGASTCRAFSSGYRFELSGHFIEDLNEKSYVLVSVNHGVYEGIGISGAEEGATYTNNFTCIPFETPYRPPLATPKPIIGGIQSAIVTGPPGEEIYTDKYGRVKVQFHWDREGMRDDKSSCWIRVSQAWAGAGWGAMIIPRIGHEVLVDFLESDPDRPIITGRVYHGTNMPPYPLPGEKTKSTLKSESSIGGGGFNEIRFEDKKGAEEIFTHAQKNQNEVVENNMSTSVGVNQSISVGKDQTITVKKNRTITIKENNDALTVKTGTRTVTVKGNTSLTVQAGDYTAKASNAIVMHGQSKGVEIQGKGKGVTIKGTGGSGSQIYGSPNFEAEGKTEAKIKSNVVKIQGTSKIDISAPHLGMGNKVVVVNGKQIILDSSGSIAIGASSNAVVFGGKGSVDLSSGGVKIKGPTIKLN